MKKRKFFVCLLSLMFFVLAFSACQQGGGVDAMRGTIAKDAGSGAFNFTSGGKTYLVEGQQDLAAMVGKFVNVQGTVSEKDGKSIITIASVKE